MGAIASLKNWWQSIVSKDDFEALDSPPKAQDLKEAALELKKLKVLLDAWAIDTFSYLGKDVADEISRRVRRAARDEDGEIADFVVALREGLTSDFFRGKRKAFAFLFEARYTEDAEVIFGKVCSAYGIEGRFLYDEAIEGADPLKALPAFKDWLIRRSFDLVIFDTGGDEYCGFLVPIASCDDALARLRSMEIRATNVPSEA